MKDYEIIARAKEILLERGWNKGTYENENGQVCILGAFAYAYDEKTGDHLSDFEVGGGGYFDDIIALPQMRNLQDEIQENWKPKCMGGTCWFAFLWYCDIQ